MDIQLESTIVLTHQEKELFDFLLNFVQTKHLDVTLRTAGGWVRDKLLGKECDDIDFALDTMMGEQFTSIFINYLEEIGQQHLASGVGVIKCNPDQSKHLEVATLKIFGYDIDVVNLRCDDYTESSVSERKFGTPLEDAQRRDLTINSMFYNVNKGIIEDWTGFGINDLKNGIIRTPIDPKLTYTDDPLRVFRSIRFAVKYNFQIAPEIIETLKLNEIKESLIKKVKRQRIRTEIEKILFDKNVQVGLDLIYNNNLWDIAFLITEINEKCPELSNVELYKNKQQEAYYLTKLAIQQIEKVVLTQTLSDLYAFKEVQILFLMASLTLPYASLSYKKAKKQIPLPFYISFESLVFPEKFCNQIQQTCELALVFKTLVHQNHQEQFNNIAKLIQKYGQIWELSMELAQLSDSLLKQKDTTGEYGVLRDFIFSAKLDKAYNIQPLILGKEIMDLFDLHKQGPVIGTIKEKVFLWQARYQEGGKDELIKEIVANKNKFLN